MASLLVEHTKQEVHARPHICMDTASILRQQVMSHLLMYLMPEHPFDNVERCHCVPLKQLFHAKSTAVSTDGGCSKLAHAEAGKCRAVHDGQ